MKKKWNELTDSEKSIIINDFVNNASLINFDYEKERKLYDTIQHEREIYPKYNEPCLILKLVDPVMTMPLLNWLFEKHELLDGGIPFMGYELQEIALDKSSLMNYNDEEKNIINKAIEIIKNKGL